MAAPPYIPSFYFNTFAQGISEPYTALSAYQSGSIDENGNFLKPESSIDPLEYLIIKLKRIFAELPMGMTKAKLGNYMSTMQLFGEEAKEFGITDSEFMGLVEANLALNGHTEVSYIELCEDMASGGMATAGTSPSYNIGSVSGYDPAMGTVRRKQPVLTGMDNCEMFDVCPEEMGAFKAAKAWKHVPESDTKRYLQRYQRRNPKGHMALRSMNPDTGESDIYWIKFKPLSFMEEFGLENFNFLFENGGAVGDYKDNISDPEDNVPVETNAQEAKRNKKAFIRPKPPIGTSHADRFREDISGLVEMHNEAKKTKQEAQAHEYAARIAFHAHHYHSLKDTPHIEEYMNRTHQQILSSANANDRGSKSGDVIIPRQTDSGIEFEDRDFKGSGGNVTATFPVKFMQALTAKFPEQLSTWLKSNEESPQQFVYPKITRGDVSSIPAKRGAQERFQSAKSAIEGLTDPHLIAQRQEVENKVKGRSKKPLIVRHRRTGRYHFVNPTELKPYISSRGGQADKKFRETHQRHLMTYRTDFNNPPEGSEVFEMEKGAQDTLLSHADPAHHELLKSLTDIHTKKN
jgi:hypothetical protein